MLLRIVLLAALSAASVAHAQDPLKSSDCMHSLALLELARSGPRDKVEAARQVAAQVCFGSHKAPSRPSRAAQAPIQVPPPAIDVKPRAPLPATPTLPPPVAIDRGPTISSCDAAGCWVTDGNRLRHVTPNLMAPGGLCALAPGAAGCP
jgi:hypothetical protein